MKTASFHPSNFGQFASGFETDAEGFVVYHDDARYASATEDQLIAWSLCSVRTVRNAAHAELNGRRLAKWQANNA